VQLDSNGSEFLLKPSNLVPFATTSTQSDGEDTPNSSTSSSSTSSSSHLDDAAAAAAAQPTAEEEDPLPSEHFIVDPQEPRYAHACVHVDTKNYFPR